MKDYKSKVIKVTNNIHATFYLNGDFDISFLYDENRRWDFEFSKYNRIKQRVCIDGRTFKPITDLADNWKTFRFCLTEHTEYEGAEEAPAWIKALARWKFDKPTRYRMVEEQVGCVLFFRKEEY